MMGPQFFRYARLVGRALTMAAVFSFLMAPAAFADNPVPQVVGPVKPQAVVPGGGAFTLTVYGANFVSGATVNWNRKARSTTFVSARELKAKILASDIAQPTAGFVSVTNPAPGGGVSSSSYGLVEVHAPTSKISLNTVNNYLPGDVIFYLATADFNNDGVLDIAAADGGSIYLYLGNGDGTFQLGSTVTNDFAGGSGNFAYGDFNGDGKLDLAFASGQFEGRLQVTVVLGNGDGTFRAGSVFGNFVGSVVLTVGDFNRDGKLDVVVGALKDRVGFFLFVFLGKGDGTFKQQVKYPANHPYFVTTADINGDGVLDLVFTYLLDGCCKPAIATMLGKGDGTFGKVSTLVKPSGTCDAFAPPVVVNDFNRDGRLDLAFCQTNQIGVMLGNGDGTFGKTKLVSITPNDCGFMFTTGDFNSDLETDLLVSYCHDTKNGARYGAEYFLGKGDGTFQSKRGLKLPGEGGVGGGIVTGDFNADGLLDFVFEFALGGFSVYPQQ